MNSARLSFVLTTINLAILGLVLTQHRGSAPDPGAVLRGRALELVDDHGKVRAKLDAEPGGEVVFRLMDADGTIRVKLGAGEGGSAFVLLDEDTEPAIHMVARHATTADRPITTSIRLRNGKGPARVLSPEAEG